VEISNSDIANFLREGISLGLIKPQAAIDWADTVIADSNEAPEWAINLALSHGDRAVLDNLSSFAGYKLSADALYLLIGFVKWRWDARSLDFQLVRRFGFELHMRGLLDESPTEADWGVVLECESEEFDEGYRSKEEMEESIGEKLARYESHTTYVKDIPWLAHA
jgi:hypothetical protein